MVPENDLVAKVRELAAARPSNKYSVDKGDAACMYSRGVCLDGSEGCLIGQALSSLGVRVSDIDEGYPMGRGIADVLGGPSPRPLAVCWLIKVQVAQDGGLCWGDCVQNANAKWGTV